MSQAIKAAVRDSGLPVAHIAKSAGVPQPVLQRFLSGDRDNIRLDTAEKLCRFFGMVLSGPGR